MKLDWLPKKTLWYWNTAGGCMKSSNMFRTDEANCHERYARRVSTPENGHEFVTIHKRNAAPYVDPKQCMVFGDWGHPQSVRVWPKPTRTEARPSRATQSNWVWAETILCPVSTGSESGHNRRKHTKGGKGQKIPATSSYSGMTGLSCHSCMKWSVSSVARSSFQASRLNKPLMLPTTSDLVHAAQLVPED